MPRTCARCSECRKTFTPSARAGAKQKVCSPECRQRRDRTLARRRRRRELVEYREDERRRQRAHRAKRPEESEGGGCHAPASDFKLLDLQEKVVVLVDRALARSRASLLRDLAEIIPEAIESALALDFLPANRNIVLAAAQGLGKTMIAKNIVQTAVLAGHTALFITASDLVLDLGKQESARALERRIRYYAGITLLVIDEIGFLAFDNRNADLLFQIVSRRYEKKSIVLTTNLLFRDWSTIFPNAMCATALIERIVHHADVISIQGKSYRAREAELDTKERAQPRPKSKPRPQTEGDPPPPAS